MTCCVSRAKTGGISGALGLAEDKSDASIACRQVGPVTFTQPLAEQDEVFNQRVSLAFKRLRIVRKVDKRRDTLIACWLGKLALRLFGVSGRCHSCMPPAGVWL